VLLNCHIPPTDVVVLNNRKDIVLLMLIL